MKRHFRWMKLWAVIGTVLILITVLAFAIPRPSGTRWYGSPPLDAQGTRVKIKLPSGWMESNSAFTNHGKGFFVEFAALDNSTFLSHLTDNFRERHESYSWIRLEASRTKGPTALLKEYRLSGKYNDPNGYFNSSMISTRAMHFHQAGYYVQLAYIDDDKAYFERNHKEIMDSLTVLP